MEMMRTLVVIVAMLVIVGCSSPPPQPATSARAPSGTSQRFESNPARDLPATSFRHFMREVRLTREQPTDDILGVTLIRVDSDGTARIFVEKTNETLRAKPGQPFLGRRGGEYNVRIFGERGLILKNSNARSQSVVLEHRWAGSDITTEAPTAADNADVE